MRVVIAEDSALLRQGLERLLADEGFEVTSAVDNADDLLRRIGFDSPDVAIVDIRMPPTHTDEGLVAAERIRATHPDVGVLVLSQYSEPAYALKLLDTGATSVGYLLKDRVLDAGELASALRRVADGESVIDRTLVSRLVERRESGTPVDELTAREREVLALMAEGLTDRGIGERLVVSPKTVETHVRHILSKLDLPTSALDNRRVRAVITFLSATS